MIIKKSEQKRQSGFSDLLHYRLMVDDGVMHLKTGAFLAGFELRGPDMDTLSLQDCWRIASQIAGAFRLGAGWTIQTDHFKDEIHDYLPEAPWMPPASRVMDEEKRRRFEGGPNYYGCRYFLSLAYQPPKGASGRAEAWLFSDGHEDGKAERDLRLFQYRVQEVGVALCAEIGRYKNTFVRRLSRYSVKRATFDDFASYVRYCILGNSFPFRVPDYKMAIDRLFAADFVGGKIPQFGDDYICTIAIDGFPDFTFSGVMRGLEVLRFPFRYVQQGQCIDSAEAAVLHKGNKNKWGAMKLSFMQRMMRKDETLNNIDKVAAGLEADAGQAEIEAKHAIEYYLNYSAKVILRNRDRKVLVEQAREAMNAIKGLAYTKDSGFNCRVETLNAVRAWISSFPGHAQVERRIGVLSAVNLAHMAPLHAPYQGETFNPSKYLPPQTPPIFIGSTVGGAPFNYHSHVDDTGVSHVGCFGPQGSGKTTMLGYTVANFQRLHRQSQIFCFDKNRTLYTLTKAMRGDYYDLSAGSKSQFCPLQDIDTPQELAEAARYIEMLCSLNNLVITHDMSNAISESLLCHAASRSRSLSDFQSIIQSRCPEVAAALQAYTVGGALGGGILDGRRDTLSMSNFCVFEMDGLYNLDTRITSAVLFYLFRRIERRLDPARPTLVTVDELSSSLSHPTAVEALKRFLEQARKMNCGVTLCIQELARLLDSPLAFAVNRECKTKIFLPNPTARTGERAVYETFDATDDDIAEISAAPSRTAYVVSPNGKRMISLDLGPAAVAFITRSRPADQELVDELMAANPVSWQADFLRKFGAEEAAACFESIISSEGRKVMYA